MLERSELKKVLTKTLSATDVKKQRAAANRKKL